MPKGTNQKLKLYRLAQIMLENTDDEHYITMPEIMEELGKYEVTADRKTIYADLRDLSVLGIEVEGEPIGNRYHYRVVNRPFELPELKLLVDSIQSSKFITEKKTNTLIKKLEKLVSKYDAQRLQRQVYVSGRIKTMNESIYYTVDAIHNAISENKKIKFQYFQWNVKKEMELRHGGAWYHISPWGLSWDDENYYMIGYDAEAQMIKHYRVDKMLHIRMSGESRDGKEHFKKLDMADYAKKSFGMFRGKETSVKMLVNNSLAGVIIDTATIQKPSKSQAFWGTMGDLMVEDYKFNLSNIGSVRFSPFINPLLFSYSGSNGLSYRQDFRYNRLFRGDKLLRIVPKLGYNFTRKEFYWSLNADFEYWPQKRGFFRLNVGNGNRIYSSKVLDELKAMPDSIFNFDLIHLDYFKDLYFNFRHTVEVVNGLDIGLGFSAHKRTAVEPSRFVITGDYPMPPPEFMDKFKSLK